MYYLPKGSKNDNSRFVNLILQEPVKEELMPVPRVDPNYPALPKFTLNTGVEITNAAASSSDSGRKSADRKSPKRKQVLLAALKFNALLLKRVSSAALLVFLNSLRYTDHKRVVNRSYC